MGRDKSQLEIEREGRSCTMLAWALERVRRVVPEVLLADGGRDGQSGAHGQVHRVADGAGRGPAAGILGAAQHAPGRPLLVLASDLPDVPVALLELLLETHAAESCDWVTVRVAGTLHPLCAVMGPAALDALADSAGRGCYSLWNLYRRASLRRIALEARAIEEILPATASAADALRNVNTPSDYASARGG